MTRHIHGNGLDHWRAPLATVLLATVLGACGSSSPTTSSLDTESQAPASSPSTPGATASASTSEPAQASASGELANSDKLPSEIPTDISLNEVIAEGPIACGPIDLSARLSILELVNESRAAGQFCANEWFPAADPLSWDDRLEQAAIRHSNDMATYDVFSHTGTDGSSVSDRASDAGFRWNRIGENIAAGQRSAEQAIQGWLDSPGHCRNIMQPAFTRMSVACEVNSNTQFGNYWTQVLGNER